MPQLENLLNQISPENTIDRFGAQLDGVLNSFPYPTTTVNDYSSFVEIVGRFCWQVESTMRGQWSNEAPDVESSQGYAINLIMEVYHSSNAKPAFMMAKDGVEGGLYGVLRKIGEAIATKYADRQIRAEVGFFVAELSEDGEYFLDTVLEYVGKFRQILPPETLANDALAVKMNFSKVLEQHPYLVKRMRNVGRL